MSSISPAELLLQLPSVGLIVYGAAALCASSARVVTLRNLEMRIHHLSDFFMTTFGLGS